MFHSIHINQSYFLKHCSKCMDEQNDSVANRIKSNGTDKNPILAIMHFQVTEKIRVETSPRNI